MSTPSAEKVSDACDGMAELVFVGTGVSTAIPLLGHLATESCAVCLDAIKDGSHNRRNNVSMLIKTKENKNILIDIGKTFRDAFMRVLIPHKVRAIDALLLTHEHADAIQGLDDLRDLQPFDAVGTAFRCTYKVPTFISPETLTTLERQVGYIVRESQKPDVIERRVTCLDLNVIPSEGVREFDTCGVKFFTLPVFHGGDYRCFGFAFGVETYVVYISDVSSIPPDTMAHLKSHRQIDILVLDCLLEPGKDHFSHFCMDQFWNTVVELAPKKAYGVGMYCTVDHNEGCAILRKRLEELKSDVIEDVTLAHDGLTLRVLL